MTALSQKYHTPVVVYQGEAGANSHMASDAVFPDGEPLPRPTFESALATLKRGDADLAMIPVENSLAGRVSDIHHLLPDSGLHIIGEHFQRVRHQLLVLPGTQLSELKTAHSHIMALGQCRHSLQDMALHPVAEADTAGAARIIKEASDKTQAAIASDLAAEVYGLEILVKDIEDADHNTTRFLILARDPDPALNGGGQVMTTFIFRVRNVPAALYKVLGGFATNGINMTKLESYQLEGSFNATMFYADIEGHPEDKNVKNAMEELNFYTHESRILGTYYASAYRKQFDL